MGQRWMNRLKQFLFCAFGDDAAHGREDPGKERELLRPEIGPAVSDLTQENRQEILRVVHGPDDRLDHEVEVLIQWRIVLHRGTHALRDRREDVTDDAGIERALVGKVVVNHRLVDASAAGDAIDGGAGETVRAEFVACGVQDAFPRVREGGFGARHLLTDWLANRKLPHLSSSTPSRTRSGAT